MYQRILIAFFFIISFPGYSQFYDIGQEPDSIKWRQIRTENFRLVFPDYYTGEAEKAVHLFEKYRNEVSASMDVSPRHTPVVFHTGSVYSNAYTVWAPRRLELLTLPPQDIYAQPWNEQLVIHEFRHIVQISKVDQGFTHFLGYLLGQQAAPAVIGLFVPPWFMEGDAVAIETALSNTGRGRSANFAMPLRTQLRDKGAYHYTKAVLGSYKDFVPNAYILGYHLVAAGRYKYGTELWNSALGTTGRKPYILNPFSKGIKNVSGMNKKGLYNESVKVLDSLWKDNSSSNYSLMPVAPTKTYTNYISPFPVDDYVVALKNSFSDIQRFVRIYSDGSEEVIHKPGYLTDDEISFNGSYISWVEQRPHVRWQTHSYSDIVMLDPRTGHQSKIRTKLRVFAPEVGHKRELIVTSEVTPAGENFLTFLDLSGKIIKRVASPGNMFISSPSWSPGDSEIALLLTDSSGKQLSIYKFSDSSFHALTPFMANDISNPDHLGGSIIFNMDVNEKSEVCSLDIATRQIRRITQSASGTSHPFALPGESRIFFSAYTSEGYRIASLESDIVEKVLVQTGENNQWPLADTLAAQEYQYAILSEPANISPVEDYSKLRNLFYFHSWAPAYVDIDNQSARPGFSIMSQNLLSTMFVTAGYDYDPDEETGQFKVNISDRSLYPVINTSVSYGNRASWDTTGRYTWQETSWDIGAGQWLSSYIGRYTWGFYGLVRHQLTGVQHTASTPGNFREGIMGSVNYRAYFNLFEKSAFRNLAPRTGFTVDFRFRHSIYGDFRAGNLFSAQGRIYLPGIMKDHTLQLYAGYQSSKADPYRFASDISIPAGFGGFTLPEMVRIRPSYGLPVAYPDWHVGTAFYLKRLRTNLFYDRAFSQYGPHDVTFTSIGGDLVADFHLLSLPAPFSAGIRSAWLDEEGKWDFSLIFSFDFSQY